MPGRTDWFKLTAWVLMLVCGFLFWAFVFSLVRWAFS